jgi:hypothetical protein
MAITKASASGLAGSKFKDASAGTAKVVDVPDQPTVNAANTSGSGASVSFGASTRGGIPTAYTVTSSPGSVTATGNTSPIVVTGLTPSTSYTFTVRAENVRGNSPQSGASSSVTTVATPSWQTGNILTFNSTQNYAVDTMVSDIAMVVFSGGGNGNGGSTGNGVGNGGQGGTGGNAWSGVAAMPGYGAGGSTVLVTVGAGGLGTTSVGSYLNSSGGGNATSKAQGNVQASTGTGGNVQVGSGLFTVQNFEYGGRGGQGGWGASENQTGPGNAPSSPYGGAGGGGGSYWGSAGGGATGNGPAGGGGGGGGYHCPSGGRNGPGGGGSGFPGTVRIIEKKSI